MNVHEGQLRLRVRLKEALVAVVDAAEVVQELNGRRRQVHDKVGDGRRDGDAGGLRARRRRAAGDVGWLDDGAVAAG